MTNYLKDEILTTFLSDVYVALFNQNTEINKASYKRQKVTFVTPDSGQTSNGADVLFPIAEENWGDVSHIAIYDRAQNGNELFKKKAEFTKEITTSAQYKIPKNYLIIRIK